MAILAFLGIFALGAWDSGAFDNGGFDVDAVRDGSDGKICRAIDVNVLQYDGSRCPGDN